MHNLRLGYSNNMKRIFASIGLVAVGASSLHAQYAPELTEQERVKPISLSASLRGFYDDNFSAQVSSRAEHSWGLEVSPSVSFNHSSEQTLVSASYVYDLKQYTDPGFTDQTHQFNARLDQQFTERYRLKVNDSFVSAHEPDVIDPVVRSSFLRTASSNTRNLGNIDFSAELTPLLAVELSYNNAIYNYNDAAFSALLDRMEHLAGLDLRYKALQKTTAVLGYHFGAVQYGNKPIFVDPTTGVATPSALRNSRSHFFLAGVDQTFTETLLGSVRVGGQYFDYYRLDHTQVSPYADASVTWTYKEGCNLQGGVKHLHNATDEVGVTPNNPVLDAESTALYVSVTHKITPKLVGNVLGQYQNSVFNGGTLNNESENYFFVDANLAYHFNPWFMAEAGYTYDNLKSDLRGFDRNRVYLGIRATY